VEPLLRDRATRPRDGRGNGVRRAVPDKLRAWAEGRARPAPYP
jgi:hypothetical protein